jgi:hypothetical protein
MNQNLLAHGLDPTTILVYQYNKRISEVTPMEAMDRTLNARRTERLPRSRFARGCSKRSPPP